jgi:hypothetical protein
MSEASRPPELEASRARHQEMTQLQVSRSLRAHQREWFEGIRQDVFEGGKPYILTGGVFPHEIFEALDLPFIVDVWYSALVAAQRKSAHYSDYLTASGYHEGLNRYGSLALAVILDKDNPDAPWGGLPRPSLVATGYWDRPAQILAQTLGLPHVGYEQPIARHVFPNWWEMSRWQSEDLEGQDRIDVMKAQFLKIVEACERVAGKKMDYDRLREIVDRVNRQELLFDEVRTMVATSEKAPVRMAEAMTQVMGIQWHRGTEWAYDQAKAFRDEVKARVDNKQWVLPNEKYRMMYIGAFLSQALDFFSEFEQSHGVMFVRSNYMSIAVDGYLRMDTRDPLRALASRYATVAQPMHMPPWSGAWALWEGRRHRVDGCLMLSGFRGRQAITRVLEENGIPTLLFRTDAVDAKKWDGDRLRGEVRAFIEERMAHTERRVA